VKILPALFFIALGIWIAFAKPEIAFAIYHYVDAAFTWVFEFISELLDGAKG